MRRNILSILLIIFSVNFIFSQEEANISDTVPDSNEYIFQLSFGPSYSFYFYNIQLVIDSMDEGSPIRIPFSIDFLFAKKMSKSTAWTVSLNSGLDFFFSSSDSFQVYTMFLNGGFQYIPPINGLSLGLAAGISMLIPNTNLTYIGSLEFGSGVSLNINYSLYSLKFSKAGLIPGLGLKLIHLEMVHGPINQICGYMSLRLRWIQ